MKKIYITALLLPLATLSVKSQVIFEYDEAGNQIYRGLGSANKSASPNEEENTREISKTSLAETIGNKIKVAPVPVKTDLSVFWEEEIKDYIAKVDLLPYNAFNIIETVNISNLKTNSYIFRMSHLPYGVYYLRFYLNDGSIYTVTVTKN